MPKIAYSQEERQRIREALISTGFELFAKQGIQHTTVEQIYRRVGISRTFFYSFFPAKEDLVVEGFYRQQPKLMEYAKSLMDDPNVSWRDGVKQLLYACCDAKKSRFVVMTVEEQQAIFKHLSADNFKAAQEKQIQLFAQVLEILGIPADEAAAKLFCNLTLSLAVVRKAIPNTLPFLFPEAADETAAFQINALVDYLESLRERHKP